SYGDPNGDIDVAADGSSGMDDDASDVAQIESRTYLCLIGDLIAEDERVMLQEDPAGDVGDAGGHAGTGAEMGRGAEPERIAKGSNPQVGPQKDRETELAVVPVKVMAYRVRKTHGEGVNA